MATTQVDVYNRAMANLGQISAQKIEDVTEDTPDANMLNRFYAQSLDDFLEEAWWGWATKYETLALDSSTPPERWIYAYVCPADCAAPRFIVGDAPEERIEFIEGTTSTGLKVIWTDRKNAELCYTARIENFNSWGGAAVSAFALKLASDAALAFAGDTAKSNLIEARYERQLEKAVDASHNRQHPREEDHNETLDARHGDDPAQRTLARYDNTA